MDVIGFSPATKIETTNSKATSEQFDELSPVDSAVLDVLKHFNAIKNEAAQSQALLEYIQCVIHFLKPTNASSAHSPTALTKNVIAFLERLPRLLLRIFESANQLPDEAVIHLLARLELREKSKESHSLDYSYEERLEQLDDLADSLCERDDFDMFPSQLKERPRRECYPQKFKT